MKIDAAKQIEIIEKKDILEKIKTTLKTEFFGLDNTIDEVLKSVEPWYMFNEYQTRPLVVNLWGMTGTGKTTLVRRLSDLLDKNIHLIHFDMGEQIKSGDWSIKNQAENALENYDKKPCMICLDEFQLCRTINQDDYELDRSSIRIFWELIDTGQFYLNKYFDRTDYMNIILYFLEECVRRNVKVTNGMITCGKDIYSRIIKSADDKGYIKVMINDNPLMFIPESIIEDLFEIIGGKFDGILEFEEYIKTLNEKESIQLVKQAVLEQTKKSIDLRHSIIFVLGNLDEVFTFGSDINPDVDPDTFYKNSLSINITQIKEGLAKRFRIEQIARLGNNHIIYPALSMNAYTLLIEKELNKIVDRIHQQIGIKLIFDRSVNELIRKEGVFPAQGARPIFTTIVQLIEASLGSILYNAILDYQSSDTIYWTFHNKKHEVSYLTGERLNGQIILDANVKLEILREVKDDDKQALIAVHESGHAVAAIMSSRILPKKIISKSPMGNYEGAFFHDWPEKIVSKLNIEHRVITCLGGYFAEKMLFTDDNVSTGSETDLQRATNIVNDAIKNSGMGNSIKSIHVQSLQTNEYFNADEETIRDAENLLEKCKNNTIDILNRNKILVIEIAKFLLNNSEMNTLTIKKYVEKFSDENWIKDEGYKTSQTYYSYKQQLLNA